jgi:hypothetical protein
LTFIKKHTNVIDRLYYAWCAVFIVRIRSAWLERTDSTELKEKISYLFSRNIIASISKPDLFISIPSLFSLGLNAHSLTYLVILVVEQTITEDALNITLFNSQICEGTFHLARSMSGSCSSVVNFSVNEFLQRVETLAVLQRIKTSSDSNRNNIIFPKHHKQKQSQPTRPANSTSTITRTITKEPLEETVFSVYLQASQILSGCSFPILNPNGEIISFEEVNSLAYKKLRRKVLNRIMMNKRKTKIMNNINIMNNLPEMMACMNMMN